ncbi:hypothetical protein OQA88_9732 [Cercophora sp. LCS_1]
MAACRTCQEPLTLILEPDSDDEGQSSQPQTVPDDLALPCGCHHHWQCIFDKASTIAISLSCPSCSAYLPSNAPGPSVTNAFLSAAQATPILATYTNEGGTEEDLDIMPALTEEAYLTANPEARPARAMHTMAAAGDGVGIMELLTDVEEEEDFAGNTSRLLRWTDPLNGGRTVLHVAIEEKQEEVFWLLLWLGSGLKTDFFPAEVMRTADALGLPRRDVPRGEDARFLVDEAGRSPADLLVQMGPPWSLYVDGGLFM